jgi:hypothetical protein
MLLTSRFYCKDQQRNISLDDCITRYDSGKAARVPICQGCKEHQKRELLVKDPSPQIEDEFKDELPMEYAVELNKLLKNMF